MNGKKISEAEASLINRACPEYRFAREAEREFGMVPVSCPEVAESPRAVCFQAYGATVVKDAVKGFRRLRFFVDGTRALEVRMATPLMRELLKDEG